MKRLFYVVTLLVCATALSQTHGLVSAERTRFYKAECGTAADYLELAKDGTYRVIDREHMGVSITEQGHWQQDGSVITFRPSAVMRGGRMVSKEGSSYGGAEIKYKGRTFIAFNAEGAAGMVIPVDETRKQLDTDPQAYLCTFSSRRVRRSMRLKRSRRIHFAIAMTPIDRPIRVVSEMA